MIVWRQVFSTLGVGLAAVLWFVGQHPPEMLAMRVELGDGRRLVIPAAFHTLSVAGSFMFVTYVMAMAILVWLWGRVDVPRAVESPQSPVR